MHSSATQHLSKDPVLKKLIEASPQLELLDNSRGNVYEGLISSIISQQLSGKVATVIKGRFYELFADSYPHPEKLLEADMETLRSVGLSRQKANYLQNVATFFQEERIDDSAWDGMGNEAIIDFLTRIKGVGKWTVEMILMFSLGRPDVLPVDDLGIRIAFTKLYNLTETGKELKERMTEIAESWRPYRSYACLYLWQYKDSK